MNCEEAKRHFIESVYGELDPRRPAGLEQHLASCAACRNKLGELKQSREWLDLLAEKPVHLDANAVLEQAAGRAVRRSRRWRLAAVAATGVAACLLAVMLSGVRVEWDRTHVVVAWGHGGGRDALVQRREPGSGSSGSPAVAEADPWPALRQQGERLAALDELVRLVVAELKSAEGRQRSALGGLRREFAELRAQDALRWKLVDEDVRDLGATYLAAYRPAEATQGSSGKRDHSEKGDRP